MRWFIRYWVAIVIALVSIGTGVGVALLSSGRSPRVVDPTIGNNDSIFNTYAPGVGDDLSNLINLPTNTNKTTKKVVPGTYPTPLPTNQVPWGTGASLPAEAGGGQSDQTPSTGGGGATPSGLPPEQTPWGIGPSQQ